MKVIFETYGGLILALIAAIGVLTINLASFYGPLANQILLAVNQAY